MNVPENLQYTKDHEWVQDTNPGIYRIGITDYAQDALGDIVFVEVKDAGTKIKSGEAFGEAESTKSVSDLYSPISGVVKTINENLTDTPELINSDPYGEGWICEIEGSTEGAELLKAEQYLELIKE